MHIHYFFYIKSFFLFSDVSTKIMRHNISYHFQFHIVSQYVKNIKYSKFDSSNLKIIHHKYFMFCLTINIFAFYLKPTAESCEF